MASQSPQGSSLRLDNSPGNPASQQKETAPVVRIMYLLKIIMQANQISQAFPNSKMRSFIRDKWVIYRLCERAYVPANRRITRSVVKQAKEQGQFLPLLHGFVPRPLGIPKTRAKKDESSSGLQQESEMTAKNDDFPQKRKRGTEMTKEEFFRILVASEGFEVLERPPCVETACGAIAPINIDKAPELESYSKLALDKYNRSSKKTKYEFGKVLKANWKAVAGFLYYITFQAKPISGSPTEQNFQTLVYRIIDKVTVTFCRLEKKY